MVVQLDVAARGRFAAGLAVMALLGSAGCGVDSAVGSDPPITVFAASSLRVVLDDVAAEAAASPTGVPVVVSYAGSADLVAQVEGGAPADVLITADRPTMDRAVAAGSVEATPVVIALNTPMLAVAEGNPRGIRDLADAAAPGVDLVVCAPQVPCGAVAQHVAERAGVRLSPVSEENSVTDVLGKVITGQASAGVVYATDVRAAEDKVDGVALPVDRADRNPYLAAVVAHGDHAPAARDFVRALTGPDARQRLADAGFGLP